MIRKKVLILCNPCHGFGDVIFGNKIKNYLKKWYDCKVKIATTAPELFKKIGVNKQDIIHLQTLKMKQCRNFSGTTPDKKLSGYDLIFVTPLVSDKYPSIKDIKKIIPYSDTSNTFFFSEYNDKLNKGFDFNTGIGMGRDGLLFTDVKTSKNDIKNFKLGSKYALSYIAETISRSDLCFLKFLNMLTTKYNFNNLQIICPDWIQYYVEPEKFLKYIDKNNFSKLVLVFKDDEIIIGSDERNTVIIRLDIFPVQNDIMLSLIKYSLKDILLTGDQSITDALSCCSSKNIFYQIAPWKKDFTNHLIKELPNSYLSSCKTSCGTLKAIKYKSNYKEFVKKWDFRKIGKAKLDIIFEHKNKV